MKIAFICTDRGPCPPVKGGAIQLLISKVAPLLARNHEVTVFSITDVELPDYEMTEGVRYERFDKSNYFQDVCNRVGKMSFEIIQVYNRPQWVSNIRQAAPNARVFLSLHNLIFETLKGEKDSIIQGIKNADGILTVSKFIARDTAKKIANISHKMKVLYTGADIDEYNPIWTEKGKRWRHQIRTQYSISDDDTVILFVGRLVRDKGCHIIIEAVQDVILKHPKTKLLIVGSKWYADDSSSNYIDKLKIQAQKTPNHVLFTSYIPVKEIPKYFASADLFICPSQWQEPLARVHYEAMAQGLPIITTNRGGNSEILQNGKNGFLIENYKEADEYAKMINKLLENPKKAERMAKNGRIMAEQYYNFNRVATVLETMYKKFVNI